jgi:hypothetical protein
MEPELKRRGIRLFPMLTEWDILDPTSTTRLLHRWMQHTGSCHDHFLLVANCSGFLHDAGKFKEAKIQLEELFRWAAERRSTVAWLEPQTGKAMKGMWPIILKKLGSVFGRFISPDRTVPETPLCSEGRFQHPLQASVQCDVRLSLTRLARTER